MSDTSLLDYLGRPFRLTDHGVMGRFFGGSSYAGKQVSASTMLSLSASNACIRLISETIATLPISVYERLPSGERREVDDHPVALLLKDSPNADQTPVEYLEGKTASLLMQGDGFSAKERGYRGKIDALRFLNPVGVSTRRDPDTDELFYRFRDRNREIEELPASEVFHVKGFGLGGDRGETPIGMQRHTLGTAVAAEETAGKMLGQGLQSPGFLKYKGGQLKPDQRESLLQVIGKFAGSANAGKMMVLEADLDWQNIGMKAEDFQLLQARRHAVEEICRWYRVPPILVGHAAEGQTMFGSGVEQIMIAWLTLGLRTYLKRFESAISKRLFEGGDRRRFYAEFNVEGLLRGDMKAQAEYMSSVVQNGIMTRAELRKRLNLTFVEGSDILTVQLNLADISKLGQSDPSAVVKAALIDLLSGGKYENQGSASAA
jgi:HK97 family phage portal protein